MSKFDTHGGYFAPLGYMRVDEGGSHEENPNGGVQVGVDPNGTPNMLEEGEPIYKDFVFSDNIKADKQFLEDAGIPTKYAGKLYSEIADSFLTEAELRPNDEISANGLNAMLGRLAQAQEMQKAAEQQAELEQALAEMSPEELAALEQMMTQEQQPIEQTVPAGEVIAPEQIAPEQIAPEQQMQPEMMPAGYAEGGFLDGVRHFFNGPDSFIGPDGKEYPIVKGEPPVVGKAVGALKAVPKAVKKGVDTVKAARKARQVAKGTDAALEASVAAENAVKKGAPRWLKRLGKGAAWTAGLGAAGAGVNWAVDTWGNPTDVEGAPQDYVFDPNDFNLGGNIFWPGGQKRAIDLLRGYEPAVVTANGETIGLLREAGRNAGYQSGDTVPATRAIEPNFWRRIISSWVDRNGESVPGGLRTLTNTGVMYGPAYLLREPKGENDGIARNPNTGQIIGPGTPKFNADLVDQTTPPERTSRTAATGSPVARRASAAAVPAPTIPTLLSDTDLDAIINTPADTIPGVNAPLNAGKFTISPELVQLVNTATATPASTDEVVVPALSASQPSRTRRDRNGNLTTLPRYAGAIGSTLLAMQNLMQQPDHYDYTPIRPVLPYGDINLQDERYMPIDMEMQTNQVLANNAGTARTLRNSGLGPSLGATLLAGDYNGNQALGNALNQGWLLNNQERNRVINANNQNEATRAQFYRNLDSERINHLNNFARINQQNALRIAMLNDQAEQNQYNAFGQNLGNALQALSGIGTENFAMNQALNNRALLYAPGWDGSSYYRGYNCGGTMLKKYKK